MKFLLSYLFFLGLNGFAFSRIITSYPSFNEKYIAQFSKGDRDTALLIKDQLTQKNDYSQTLLMAVEHVQWTPDSTSLLIVEHISGGSTALIIHHHSSCWTSVSCDPPLHFPCDYLVMGVHFLDDMAEFIYCVYPSRGSPVSEQKICIFNIDLITGATTLKKLGPLTKEDYAKLTEHEKSRWEIRKEGTAEQAMSLDYF